MSWVLTAAHCLNLTSLAFIPPVNITNRVFAGTSTHNLYPEREDGLQFQLIVKTHFHPRYSIVYSDDRKKRVVKVENDVALLKTKKPFFHTSYVDIVKLRPAEGGFYYLCSSGVIIGIGSVSIEDPGRISPFVQYAEISPKMLTQLGIKLSQEKIRKTVFYSLTKTYEGSPLQGDVGGPFLCYHVYQYVPVQYGIISTIRNVTINREQYVLTEYESIDKHMRFIKTYVPDVKIFKGRAWSKVIEKKQRKHEKQDAQRVLGSKIIPYFYVLRTFYVLLILIIDKCV